MRRAEDLVKYAIAQSNIAPTKFLKEKFSTGFDPTKSTAVLKEQDSMDVFYHIDEYLKAKDGKVKPCTLNVIGAMKKHLLSFQNYRKKPVTFESFDVTFYEQFVDYLIYQIPHMRRTEVIKGLKINSIGKTVKHLKSFLKDRMKKKVIPVIDLSDYKVLEEDVDSVYLRLATVVVPLQSDAKVILIDKYKMKIPQVSNPNFNEYIKEVYRLAGIIEEVKITHKRSNKTIEEVRPKYAWITSHTCRRSFCTNEYLASTPTDLIMTISGHKTEKAFRKYIKADKVQKANMIKKL